RRTAPWRHLPRLYRLGRSYSAQCRGSARPDYPRCENVHERRTHSIVFSIVFPQKPSPVLLLFILPKLRKIFYVPAESWGFHTASGNSGRTSLLALPAARRRFQTFPPSPLERGGSTPKSHSWLTSVDCWADHGADIRAGFSAYASRRLTPVRRAAPWPL